MPALPGPSRWRAPLPGTSTSTSPLPAASRIRLPAGGYEPPPYTEIHLAGHGTLLLVGAPAVTADLAGSGAIAFATTVNTELNFSARAFLSFGQEAEFNLAGNGDLDFAAAPNLTTAYAGTGVLTMAASAGTALDLTGSGSLAASAAPRSSLALTGVGTLSATADGLEWFQPSGMNKNGSTFDVNSSTPTTITGWVPTTGTYPGSTVSGNALVANGSKTGATISASITWSSNAFDLQRTVRLLLNGVQIASAGPTTGTSTMTMSTTANVQNGDLVTVTAHLNSTQTVTVAANTSTVTIT